MSQVKTLLYKNFLLVRRSPYEAVLILACCIILPIIATFIVSTNSYKKYSSTPAANVYTISTTNNASITLALFATPNTSDVRSIVGNAVLTLSQTGLTTIPVFFNDPVAMAAAMKTQFLQVTTRSKVRIMPTALIGVEFAQTTAPSYVYYLRPNGDYLPFTNRYFVPGVQQQCYGTIKCPASYLNVTRLVHVQYAIDQALLSRASNNTASLGNVQIWKYPIPPTVYMSSLFPVINLVLPITFAFIPLFRYITGKLVEEKECSMKQLLVVMGVRMKTFVFSWFVVFTVVLVVVSAFMTLIIFLGKVIVQSIGMFFFLTLAHSMCIFAVSFFMSTFFTKTRSASVFTTFASLLMSMIYFVIPFTRQDGYPFTYGLPVEVVYVLMVIPTFTYSLAVDLMFFSEIFANGVKGQAIATLGQIPAVWLLVVLVVSFFAYMILGLVLERLLSPEYGDRPSWFSSSGSKVSASSIDMITYPDEDFERTNGSWRPMIRISDLWKVFKQKSNEIIAVRGITLDIFDSQITCILGHNGAGKSTLIAMMTRLLRPTRGTITFTDPSVQNQGRIGICLQSSTHYNTMTVREHLDILSRLKKLEKADDAIDKVLKEVGLYEHANKTCSNLSGGQQRRLNVAIALIGDPKVIFLDEPTTGVDPLSRRAIWQILQSRKANHCIILTTHYMDEADILADRKAIVSRGTLRCTGSSLFLKNRFGAGYHLNVEMRSEIGEAKLSSAKAQLLKFIVTSVPDATVREETQTMMSITLPFSYVQTFPKLFKQLEAPSSESLDTTLAQSLGIRTYGIELTTLEEVFLRLASENEHHDNRTNSVSNGYGSSKTFVNAAYLGDSTNRSSSSNSTNALKSSDNARMQNLRELLQSSRKMSTMGKWLVMLQLRFRIAVNAWLSTIGVIFFSPLLVFALVCMFAVVFTQFVNLGYNTLRFTFNPLMYAAASGNQTQTLPPFVYDNRSDINVTQSASTFIQTMNQLQVQAQGIDNSTMGYNLGLSMFANSRVWFGDVALHSPPVSLTTLSNFVMRLVNSSYSITTINAPIGINMPALAANDSGNDNRPTALQISVDQFVILLPMGLTIIYIVSASRLHTEFNCGSFNQLRCTGITGAIYWSVQLAIDSFYYILSAALSIVAIILGSLIFGAEVQYSSDVIVCEIIAIILYMPASLLFLYIIVLLLRNTSGALVGFTVTVLFFVLPGCANGILQIQLNTDDVQKNFPPPYYGFLIFPNFQLYNAIVAITYAQTVNRNVTLTVGDYFKPENQLLWSYVTTILEVILQTVLLLALHKHLTEKHSPLFASKPKESHKADNVLRVDMVETRDSDVVSEELAINDLVIKRDFSITTENDFPALVCHDLTLSYNPCSCTNCRATHKTKTAVNGLTVSAPNSQIFGLLGPNGAGKTSTLKVVSGAERPTIGTIYVGGTPIASMPLGELFDKVSVCTQDDGLWMMLTIRDHLDHYARLRGFEGKTRTQLVNTLIDLLEIGIHADKQCEQLSGGTKRKVVFAISMMKTSRLRLILCDEPTSGLDPQSKRVLWNVLTGLFRGVSQSDCACIFTSHSMEEVEAVCDRIGIMINGQLHCLGTIQHCKDKYGNMYSVELKLRSADGNEKLLAYLQSKFPLARQVESYVDTNLRINIPRADVSSLGYAFEVLEEVRRNESFELEEYSFGQTTLEQVFLDLVKKHGSVGVDE